MKIVRIILFLFVMIVISLLAVVTIYIYAKYGGKPIGEIPAWIYLIFFGR